jgi:anti-sigma-K factor RskA
MTEHPFLELASAYAIGALNESDRLAFETHLGGCVTCQTEVQSYRGVVGMLAHAAPAVVPPAGLGERVAASVRDLRPIASAKSARPRSAWLPYLALAASLALATFSSLSWRRELVRVDGLRQDLAFVREDLAVRDSMVAAFLGPEVHVVSLAQAEQKPSARVFWNHTKNIFIVTAFNVPRAPEGKTYQLWAISNGKAPVSMGTFNTDEAGRATVIVPVGDVVEAAGFIDNCAMTLEPLGGSPQPTEQPRLIGAWRHVD